MNQEMEVSYLANRKLFAFGLIFFQVVMCVMFSIFVRHEVQNDPFLTADYYTFLQDINVMILIGFGFLYTFIRRYAWSALSYTFFINALAIQLYILISAFWDRVFRGWDSNKYIYINEKTFITAAYCVASILVAFGAVLGRVGPFELLIMTVIQVIGYSLNQVIVYYVLHMYDAGGSTTIHAFGAYFGLTISYILGKRVISLEKPKITYISNVFALIGTFFLWIFWPSINAGFFSTTPYERSIIITNTILALAASNLGCFIMTALLQKRFFIDHIQNATLAGGVIIGASAGIITNPGACLIVGAFGGIISSLGYSYMHDILKNRISIHDTAGVHNVHGIPGILGGLVSAAAIAAYNSDPLTNQDQISYLGFYAKPFHDRTFIEQGAIQVAGTGVSVVMGILFGILAGLLMSIFYRKYIRIEFYNDHYNFEQVALLNEVGAKSSPLIQQHEPVNLRTQQRPLADQNGLNFNAELSPLRGQMRGKGNV